MTDIHVAEKLDQIDENIMSGLKDFQRATVNRIEQLFRDGQRRVLVSDEVGLGKTLIARGTVSKLAKIRREEGDDLVKVVYVCSNGAIAEQNLNKLKISSELKVENTGSSRLSMQHLHIYNQENDTDLLNRYIQLIPLTPDTSFRMTSGAGTVNERALMFAILKRVKALQPYERALSVAMKDQATLAWRDWAEAYYEKEVLKCNEKSEGRYLTEMLQAVETELNTLISEESTLLDLIIQMCEEIKENHYKQQNNNYVIGRIRVMFAKISLDKLNPDLVIMDEFQRFKYLLGSEPGAETRMLADKFFSSKDVRMLLLSATPYKMYSTLEEIDEANADVHYSEFLAVMDFLNITPEEQQNFRTVWNNYSVHLKELTNGDTTFLTAKNAAEDAMYQCICRTERISAVENADIIDDKDVADTLRVLEQDVQSYLDAQKLLEEIGAAYNVPVDYVKSAPYLISFMRDYKLKKDIENYFKKNPDELKKINKKTLWVDRKKVDRYEEIPSNNARLERLMDHTFKNNAELLLWTPPSKPYYPLQGAFEGAEGFTKTLVFSAWEMVPRMIASLVSYEAERRTVGKLAREHKEENVHYFYTGEKRYPSARLRFAASKGEAKAMSLFCLMYPSQTLTDIYDPVDCMNRGLPLKAIETELREELEVRLQKYPESDEGKEDNRWYYIAPLLMDGAGYVTKWLNSDMDFDSDEEESAKNKRQKGFQTHLQELRSLYYESNYGRSCNLGKRPADLVDVLVDMAIASPAVVVNRTYQVYRKKGVPYNSTLPTQIAKVFINRMNTAEATATVELAYGTANEDAHWQNLLSYCKDGNLQALFDEYAHLITNGLDRDDSLLENLHKTIRESMDFRTTLYNVDTYDNFRAKANGQKEKAASLRSHFAVAFTKGDNKEKDVDRKKTLRNAFNSPFRPFVLASTSIGQEGLDFHNYCRRIVHWNLPSNPIDLEQREGRINRFECLAIRQNVAKRYGDITFKSKDIWKEMFAEAAEKENDGNGSDLIPFWGVTESDDMVKIERIVPMYPYSRDGIAYERLIKILSLYRLTLGQARQEELLEYIFQNCEEQDDMRKLFMNLSPYYKEK